MIIADDPLIQLVKRLEKRGVTGIQELVGLTGGLQTNRLFVYFYDGSIEAVTSTLREHRIGEFLVREGFLENKQLNRLLKKSQKTRKPLGEVIVEENLLDAAYLNRLLTEHSANLFQLALNGSFKPGEFTGTTKGLMNYRLRLSADQLALELARRRPVELRLNSDQAVELVRKEKLQPLGWTPEEVLTLTHLRYPVTVSDLAEKTSLGEEEVIGILQVFLDLGLVRLVEQVSEVNQSLVKHEPIPLELLVPKERTPGFDSKVDLVHQNHSALSEQFRSLKVRLTNQVDPPIHSLCVTSPTPEDGKSLISTNLALSFSREIGRRVLLLECDLRNPTISEKLGIPLDPGLYQYLLEGLEPQCCMRKVDNLYIMTAGEIAHDAIELLSLARMRELMRFLRQEFDTVIVDAPPILPVADARLISTFTDATVMVIYQGKTAYSSIERAMETIDKKKLLGVILNGVKSTGLAGYYNYGHYYTYPYSRTQKEGKTIIEMRKRAKRGHSSSANIIFK